MTGFEEQLATLEDFEKWKGEKKVSANDYSPAAYLVARAESEAWDRLQQVTVILENKDKLPAAGMIELIRKVLG